MSNATTELVAKREEGQSCAARFTGGVIVMTTIIETKRLRFKRLPYTYVSGYKIYSTYGDEEERFLAYVENPLTPSLEECLSSNVNVDDGYINMPSGAYRDIAYPPKVVVNDTILTELDYSYSHFLNQVKLSSHIKISEDDQVDLIYYKDLVVYEHHVEHLNQIEPVTYRVEPIYRNTQLIGSHNII